MVTGLRVAPSRTDHGVPSFLFRLKTRIENRNALIRRLASAIARSHPLVTVACDKDALFLTGLDISSYHGLMVEPKHKQQLDEAIERLGELAVKKGELEIEIAKQRQLVSALANMLPDDEQVEYRELAEGLMGKPTGLTDAIREALRAGAWMSASEVRDCLDATGFDFSGYTSNPLSSINTVLKRLVGDGTAVMELNKRGIPCYHSKAAAHPLDKLRAPYKGVPAIEAAMRGKKK